MANMFIDPAQRNQFLKNLTHDDFKALGDGHVAYVRPFPMLGKTHYAVHNADGEPLVIATTLAKAQDLASENDLEVITVH
jgi:hypothetical protein